MIGWERGRNTDNVEGPAGGKVGETCEGNGHSELRAECLWRSTELQNRSAFSTYLFSCNSEWKWVTIAGPVVHLVLTERHLSAYLALLQRSGKQSLLSRWLQCSWRTNIHTCEGDRGWSGLLRTGRG